MAVKENEVISQACCGEILDMMVTSNIFLSPISLKNKFHLYQLYINYQFSPKYALFCVNTLTREDVWGLTNWSLKGKNALTY